MPAAAAVVVDQLTKLAARRLLEYDRPVGVIPGFFDLRLSYNSGGAFGILPSWAPLFIIVALVAIFAIVQLSKAGAEGSQPGSRPGTAARRRGRQPDRPPLLPQSRGDRLPELPRHAPEARPTPGPRSTSRTSRLSLEQRWCSSTYMLLGRGEARQTENKRAMKTPARQPVIEVPPSPTDMAVEALALIGMAFAVAIVMWAWPYLPDRIPSHFDFWGKPDGWGPKSTLWFLPGIAAFTYVMLTVVNLFPQVFNYPVAVTEENAPRQYAIATSAIRWLKLEIVWLIAYTEWASVRTALGRAHGLSPWFMPILLVVLFATIAMLLIKAYRAK